MNPRVQIFAVVGTLFVAFFVFNLVRKRRLREEYSLLWMAAAFSLGLLAFDRPIVVTVANLLGVAYAPSALFIAAFAAVFLLLLHFSMVVSRLTEREKQLAQEIALLRAEINAQCEVEVDGAVLARKGAGNHD